MSEKKWSSILLNGYIVLFLCFMFGPLLMMSAAAFNGYAPPSVTHWAGFTLHWFEDLPRQGRLMGCLGNSFEIAGIVVPVSVFLGLAAAMLLTRLKAKGTSLLYALLVSPILMPGIVLGISTILFWQAVGLGAGMATAVMAQITFIASYPMLIIMSRMQRQDPVLEEAALDLGATPMFMFRRVTLPFLMPAILTSAVIALLMSFENYNTTVFAIGGDCTLTTEIAAQARKGHTPIINALGVIFVALTVAVSTVYVLFLRKERDQG